MASAGRPRSSRPRARAAAAVPAGGRVNVPRLDLARLVPGGRAFLTLLGIAAVATAAFLLSMGTSLFAVRTLEVSGASPAVAAEVQRTLAEARGTSLVGIDLDRLAGLVSALPTVAGVSFDRAFPHTLRVRVVPERVVGAVRQGAAAYLVSARGRVVGQVPRHEAGALPRIWAGRSESLRVGGQVSTALLPAVRAVSPLRTMSFPARVASVRVDRDELHLRLRTGVDVLLGGGQDMMLKLAVAREVLPLLAAGTTYLDVSVPERPVAGSSSAPASAAPASLWAPAAATVGTTEVASPVPVDAPAEGSGEGDAPTIAPVSTADTALAGDGDGAP